MWPAVLLKQRLVCSKRGSAAWKAYLPSNPVVFSLNSCGNRNTKAIEVSTARNVKIIELLIRILIFSYVVNSPSFLSPKTKKRSCLLFQFQTRTYQAGVRPGRNSVNQTNSRTTVNHTVSCPSDQIEQISWNSSVIITIPLRSSVHERHLQVA